MSSPIDCRGKVFTIPKEKVQNKENRFIDLGKQKGNRGIQHTIFLKSIPIENKYVLGDKNQVSGYCHYNLLYNRQKTFVLGVLLTSLAPITDVQDFCVKIRNVNTELPSSFTPSFVLEKLGVLLFVAEDSSVIAIPEDLDFPMLVKVS